MEETKNIEDLINGSKKKRSGLNFDFDTDVTKDIFDKFDEEEPFLKELQDKKSERDFSKLTELDAIKPTNFIADKIFVGKTEDKLGQDTQIDDALASLDQEKTISSNLSIDNIFNIIEGNRDDTIKEIFDETFTEYQTQNLNINGKPIIEFKDVHLSIDRQKILNGISVKIYEGDFVYLVGPSGAGKSCLVKLIYRDLTIKEGEININNRNITNLKTKELPKLRREVGVIFQDYKLLNNKTVFQNVLYSLEVTGYPKKKRVEQVFKTLKMVNILEHKDKYPNELSGGQQQRVAIARAIVDEPALIVADEPTGNLDPDNATVIMEILNHINAAGTTVVMATHDVNIVNKYQKRVILIKDGKVANESEGRYIYE